MSLTALPPEVIETLLFYLDVQDLVNAWTVIGLEGSESFWRKICTREGYDRYLGEDGSWRSVFQRNTNWMTKTFVKRDYEITNGEICRSCEVGQKSVLHGKKLILRSVKSSEPEEVFVWNIEDDPEFVTILPADRLKVGGSKLLVHNPWGVTVYSHDHSGYREILKLDLTSKFSFDVSRHYCLNNDFFVAFDYSFSVIKIFNLSDLKNFDLISSPKKTTPSKLLLSGAMLNVLLREGMQHVLRRFHLTQKEWCDDIILFKESPLINLPQLEVSSNLIVSWCSLLETYGVTPLKVWNNEGKIVDYLTPDDLFIYKAMRPEPWKEILWMTVNGIYLIFSTDKKSIIIWSSKNPEICNEMSKDEDLFLGHDTISSFLLVLSYQDRFKVIDFTKAAYLYEVRFDNADNGLRSPNVRLSQFFFVNDFFFVLLKEYQDSTESDLNICADDTFKTYKLHVYDFQADTTV